MEKVQIVGVGIHNITIDEGAEILRQYMQEDELKTIYTPNSEILFDAVKDRAYETILNSGDLVIPDGIGVVIASKFYGKPLKERVAGYDLMNKLIEIAWGEEKSIYLFGGKPGVAEEASEKIKENYEGIKICGVHHGYFQEEDGNEIINEINSRKTDVLLVALGAPNQEKWIFTNRERLDCRIAMGVGGSLDVLAGKVSRAPEFYQKAGLEWFYRLIKNPSRIGRMLKLPRFILLALYDSLMSSKD